MLTVVVPVPTAPKPKFVVLLNVSPTPMLEAFLEAVLLSASGTVSVKAVEEFLGVAIGGVGLLEGAAAAGLTLIVALPVRLGEEAVAVRLFEPAAKRVADSVVVLAPLVNETVLVG